VNGWRPCDVAAAAAVVMTMTTSSNIFGLSGGVGIGGRMITSRIILRYKHVGMTINQ
jgi:hypothetical protein